MKTGRPKGSGTVSTYTIQQRLIDCSIPVTESGCLLWTGATSNGYGMIWDGQRLRGVHCIAYELKYGPIPQGMCICHHCDVRLCFQDSHLFLGTYADNSKDAVMKGRLKKNNAHRDNIRKAKSGVKRQPFSPEHRRKIGLANKLAWEIKRSNAHK